MLDDVRRICGQKICWRLRRKPHDRGSVGCFWIEVLAVAKCAFTAEHNGAARCDLRAKAKLALPSRGWRKKLRQSQMLKIRKPGYRRVWQTPAKKPCRFENNVDLSLPEFSYRRIAKPQRKSCSEAGTTSIESCGLRGL